MLSFSHATHFLILIMPLDFQHVNQWLHFQWVDLSTTVDESVQIGCNGQVCSSTDALYTIHSCLWKKITKTPWITPTVDNTYCTLSLNCPKSFELFLFYSYFCCILFFLEGVVCQLCLEFSRTNGTETRSYSVKESSLLPWESAALPSQEATRKRLSVWI